MFLSLCETVPNGSMHGPVVVTSPTWAAGPAGSSSGWHAESLPQASSIDQQHCNSRGKDRRRSPAVAAAAPGQGGMWRPPLWPAPRKGELIDLRPAGEKRSPGAAAAPAHCLGRAPCCRCCGCCAPPRPPIPSASHSIMRRRLGPGLRHGRTAGRPGLQGHVVPCRFHPPYVLRPRRCDCERKKRHG